MSVAESVLETLVKVPGEIAKSGESELSVLDALAPPIMIDLWFFYDYHVEDAEVGTALATTLGRYQELAGRWDKNYSWNTFCFDVYKVGKFIIVTPGLFIAYMLISINLLGIDRLFFLTEMW